MKKRYTVFANKSRRAIRASKDYATLRGMDFKKAKDILTKDGFYEHEYGDKDNNNGYAVYRKGDKEVELQYRWVAGKRKGDAHAGKVTNVYVDEDINSATRVRSRRAIRASMNYSDWMESDYSIWIDGQKQTMSKYTTNRYGDHPMIVMPQYNSRTDTLTYVLYIVEDGEMIKIEDQFMSSGEAMEYGETYYEDMLSDSVWDLQHGNVNSAKKITCSYDADDIVMYFNGKKVFTGKWYDIVDTIEDLCKDPDVNSAFQDWCIQYNLGNGNYDVVFDGTPRDTAAVFWSLIDNVYEESDYSDFYVDGDGILDFEIFYADQEVGIPD